MPRGRAILIHEEELAWLRARADWPRRDLWTAFRNFWQRDDVALSAFKGLCKRHGIMTGRTGQYVPGQAPPNKGKPMPWNAASAATRFRKGNVPHNVRHLGHRRLSADGYVEVSVAQRNPYTGFERRHVPEHRWLWEKANGPVPEGHALKCLDGDRTNTDPSNWKAVPRGLLPRLNGRFGRGYDDAAAELQPTILAIAELEHAARAARKAKR